MLYHVTAKRVNRYLHLRYWQFKSKQKQQCDKSNKQDFPEEESCEISFKDIQEELLKGLEQEY